MFSSRRTLTGSFGGVYAIIVVMGVRVVTQHSPCVPPFFFGCPAPVQEPGGTALARPGPQRAAARSGLRGGGEDCPPAAAGVLAPEGRGVVCADGRFPGRVVRGAAAAGLAPLEPIDVFPRENVKDPLLAV